MSQQINLYDASLKRQREWIKAESLAIACTVVLALCLVWSKQAHHHLESLQKDSAQLAPKLESARQNIHELGEKVSNHTPNAALTKELTETQDTLTARHSVLGILKKGLGDEAASYAEILRGFSRQTVQGLWLTGFTIDSNTDALEIRGRTLDAGLLPEYIQRLSSEKAFRGRSFSALQVSNSKVAPEISASSVMGNIAQPANALPVGTKQNTTRPVLDFILTPTGGASPSRNEATQ